MGWNTHGKYKGGTMNIVAKVYHIGIVITYMRIVLENKQRDAVYLAFVVNTVLSYIHRFPVRLFMTWRRGLEEAIFCYLSKNQQDYSRRLFITRSCHEFHL